MCDRGQEPVEHESEKINSESPSARNVVDAEDIYPQSRRISVLSARRNTMCPLN